ncbi:MAG: cellulase family glycosylhydrolase [Bacteroidota bacterium]
MKAFVYPLISVILLLASSGSSAQLLYKPFGIKVCGPEFGEANFPGIYGVDYIYPDSTGLQYYYDQGFRMIDLPFRWERVQPVLMEELDSVEMKRLFTLIEQCNKIGLQVKLTLQNFGRYTSNNKTWVIGSKQLPSSALEDVWKRLANAFKLYENIYGFQIMNEPHDMFEMSWFKIAQEAINGIRSVNKVHAIFISGSEYANAADWKINNNQLKLLVDSCDNLVYEAHCYFDRDFTGRYLNAKGTTDHAYEYNIRNTNAGIQIIKPFLKWLKKNKKKGFVGEYGVPDDDPRWLEVLDKFLGNISKNGVNGAYWAAGPWWGNYRLSVEPRDGKDRPQMQILKKYQLIAQ